MTTSHPSPQPAGSDRWMANTEPRGTGVGVGGRAGLGTGKRAEDGPHSRLGLAALPEHNFVRWASSAIINIFVHVPFCICVCVCVPVELLGHKMCPLNFQTLLTCLLKKLL